MFQEGLEEIREGLIQVVLCEADKDLLEVYSSALKYISTKNGIDVDIRCFLNINAMLFDTSCRNMNECDVLLMNTRIHKENGFQIAGLIRRDGYTGEIIYLADNTDGMRESFDVGAFYYLIYQELTFCEFEAVIVACLEKVLRKKRKTLTFRGLHGKRFIEYSEIWYLKVADKTVEIYDDEHLIDMFIGSLATLQGQLQQKGLVRVHRAYIINVRYLTKIGKTEIVLRDSVTIPLGSRYRRAVSDAAARCVNTELP